MKGEVGQSHGAPTAALYSTNFEPLKKIYVHIKKTSCLIRLTEILPTAPECNRVQQGILLLTLKLYDYATLSYQGIEWISEYFKIGFPTNKFAQ